jgi:hypothetical protein
MRQVGLKAALSKPSKAKAAPAAGISVVGD